MRTCNALESNTIGTDMYRAYWRSVSKLTLTTPKLMAVSNSSLVEPEPPWKTKNKGLSSAVPVLALV